MRIVLRATWIALCLAAMPGVATAADPQHTLIYGDQQQEPVFSAVDKMTRRVLASRGERLSEECGRRRQIADLEKDLERKLLKARPSTVVFSLGMNDIWDFRANKTTEITVAAASQQLAGYIEQLRAANVAVFVTTPLAYAHPDGKPHPARATADAWAEAVRNLATETGSRLLDLHALTAGNPGWFKRNGEDLESEAIPELATAVISRLGLLEVGLPEGLEPNSRIVLFTENTSFKNRAKNINAVYEAGTTDGHRIFIVRKNVPEDFKDDFEQISNQQPRVLIMHPPEDATEASLRAWLPDFAKQCAQMKVDCYLMNHLPRTGQPGESTWDPEDPTAKQILATNEAIRAYGEQLGWPVIDFAGAALDGYQANPAQSYVINKKNGVLDSYNVAGKELFEAVMLAFMGVSASK